MTTAAKTDINTKRKKITFTPQDNNGDDGHDDNDSSADTTSESRQLYLAPFLYVSVLFLFCVRQ